MIKTTSIYLDLVRFLAALLVFIHHLSYERITGDKFGQVGSFGEDAVMIFFVLSGYVIAFVATEKENDPREYFVSRFARLYSVVIPALVFTALFDYMGRQVDFTLYEGRSNNSYPWVRALGSLFFTNQLWFFDIRYFSNVPYWSVSFEFWYYILFGVFLFMRRGARWMGLGVLAVLIGPPILLLAPVWLLGVWVYRVNTSSSISAWAAWSLLLGSVTIYFIYRYLGVGPKLTAMSDSWIAPLMEPVQLHKARFFIHDYVVGVLVAVHLIGVNSLARLEKVQLHTIEQPIRCVASYTFSLYLLHYPLLHLLSALAPWPAGDSRRTAMLIVGTAFAVVLIGSVTEKKKFMLKRLLLILWDFGERRFTMLPRCNRHGIHPR